MRRPRWIAASVMPLAVALAVAGCGSSDTGSGSSSGSSTGDEGDTNAAISIFGTEPENPLVPSNTTETGGGKILDAMFTGLTILDGTTNESKNAVAKSIDTTDSKVFKVTLNEGWKFHDGTDVKAKNFVDAWNFASYSPNAQQSASFFEQVEGYKDVHTEDPDGTDGPQQAPEPTAKTMSGLKVDGDYAFTITLYDPFSVFPLKLSYSAFYPLPDAFFTDQKAFEANPVGNGPFKFVSRTPNTDVKLTRFDDYKGPDKAHVKDVTIKIYDSSEAGYQATVSGDLDFIDTVPPSALAGDKWKTDLADRSASTEYLGHQHLAFPLYDPQYKNADLRRAISMAINRQEIIDKIFAGTKVVADGWTNPKVPGYIKGQCKEACSYNPEKAKEALAKSGFTGKIELTTNADGGHKEWMEATCNSIKNAIGLECSYAPIPTFAETRQKINAKQMTQIYRSGWVADYPSIENFLSPLLRTGGSSNDGEYSNPAFDAKLTEADKAPSVDEANKLYQEAERMLEADMPTIPLWFQTAQYGWTDRLDKVKLTAFRELDLSQVIVKK